MSAFSRNKYQFSNLFMHILIFSNLLIISNYFSILINFIFFQKLIIFILLIIFFYQIFFNHSKNKYIPIKILFFFLLILSILSSTYDWDALNIWLFHAKRIYHSGNLFEQMFNYFPSAHNDYPTILPALQAALNSFFLDLNYSDIEAAEYFFNPKLAVQANLIFLMLPLYYISTFIKNNINQFTFIILLLFISEKIILSGSVDLIISLYFSATFISLYRYFILNSNYNFNLEFLLCFLHIIILTLLKNEGLILFLVLYFSLLLTSYLYKIRINFKKKIIILASLLPIFLWKYICIKNNIYSDIINQSSFKYLIDNFFSLRNHWMIFNEIFLNKSILVSLVIFIVLFSRQIFIKKTKNSFNFIYKIKKSYFFVLIVSLMYLAILYFIYLSTPHSLDWHLQTSAYRTVLPIGMLFLVVTFYNEDNSSKYITKL